MYLYCIIPRVFIESTLRLEKEAAQRHLNIIKQEKEKVLIFMLEAQEFQNTNSVVSAGENAKILEEYLRFQEKALTNGELLGNEIIESLRFKLNSPHSRTL